MPYCFDNQGSRPKRKKSGRRDVSRSAAWFLSDIAHCNGATVDANGALKSSSAEWGVRPIPSKVLNSRGWLVEPEQCILIVDDSQADVMSLRRAFKQLGFIGMLKTVDNGADAIAYLNGDSKFADRAAFPFPDLMLLDLKMPGTNGFEVLQWLRSQKDEISLLRTVVLTTSDDVKDVNSAYTLGANSFLTKPLGFTEFKNCIEAVMRYWLNVTRAPEIRPISPTAEAAPATQQGEVRC
jgi:CheY-like chemotaxis protein